MKAPLLLVFAYLLLMGAWTFGNPPGMASDEYAHYLRAIAVGRGELVLHQRPDPLNGEDATKKHLRWQHAQSRIVEVPEALSPELTNCSRYGLVAHWECPKTDLPATGTVRLSTWVGTYPPYLYVLPGLATRLGDTAVDALLWGRLGSGVLAFALLATAIFLLYDDRERAFSLVGIFAAFTPMVIFVGSSLTPSGPEIAAGACLGAALLRLTRSDADSRSGRDRAAWVAAGASALVLTAGRDLGPVWLALYLAMAVALCGIPRAGQVARQGGRFAGAALGLTLLGMAVWLFWRNRYQVSPDIDLGRLITGILPSLSVSKEVGRQEIGVFGRLDLPMRPWTYLLWAAVLGALGLGAMVAARARERVVLILAVAAAVAVPAAVDALQRQVGFGVQGRHVLPFTIGIPLLAGELLRRNPRSWLQRRRPALAIAGACSVVLAHGWYFNAKRYIVGFSGPDPFWNVVDAGPPLIGWELLSGAVALAALLILFVGHWVSRTDPEPLPKPELAETEPPLSPLPIAPFDPS